MSLKNKILELRVFDVAIVLIIMCVVSMFVIEDMIARGVFSTINHNITRAEKIAKEDRDDLDSHLREVNEEKEYDQAQSDYSWARLRLPVDSTKQEDGCFNLKNVKRFEAMKKMAYVRKRAYLQKSIDESLIDARIKVKEALDKHEFEPNLCKDKSA